MDTSLIPPGSYCYNLIEKTDGEVLDHDLVRFGKDLREFSYNERYKEVLCPFWQRTEYGTVRCNFLNREFMDEDDANSQMKIMRHFNVKNAFDLFESSWSLSDEIKICGVNENDDMP